MRPQIKEIGSKPYTYLELHLEDECILKLHRSFAKSELISWDVTSKQDFFERFWPLEERYAFRLACIKLSKQALHTETLRGLLGEGFFSEGAILSAINELIRLGMLNDEDFEANFVQKLQRQGKSRRQIILKANQRGISPKKLISHYGLEEETLKGLIEKKYPILLQHDAPYPKKQKAMGALYRRGFSFSSISCVLKEFLVY